MFRGKDSSSSHKKISPAVQEFLDSEAVEGGAGESEKQPAAVDSSSDSSSGSDEDLIGDSQDSRGADLPCTPLEERRNTWTQEERDAEREAKNLKLRKRMSTKSR